ncbi:PIR Superfamily Protein [Plasmodium ovale wallikeri]|uniref:PIR Superfamily Protein n=1 Tax=Plasmodium ovale wallikeri TaxID=864142 RepID=A0A1A9AS13_PLAOA|nr:PIR Superfamily Protein [Plasmodium ovale wallikeri]SBT59520.1 PIR Superfamily Protein [Plasmodium ovale wallikeri]
MNRNKYNLGDSPTYTFENELNNVIERCTFCESCDNVQYFSGDYGLKKEFTSDYQNIVNSFKEVWKNITTLYDISADGLCKNYFENLLHIENYKNAKEVTDYCVNYEFIKDKLDKSNENCARFYYYLTGSSDLYKNTISKCHQGSGKYCLSFIDCHNYDPKLLLDNDKCKQTKKVEESLRKSEEDAVNFHPCPPGFRCIDDDFIYRSITFSDYRFISLIVLSIWAVILSFFFIYKFTPFGSPINNILRRKNIIRENMREEEFHKLLDSDSEDASTNFNNKEYRITYTHDRTF